jgi:hypothetical protein
MEMAGAGAQRVPQQTEHFHQALLLCWLPFGSLDQRFEAQKIEEGHIPRVVSI